MRPLLLSLLLFASLALSACQGYYRNVPTRVAVLNFENATGSENYDFLETAIAEYIITDLSRYPKPLMLERQDARLYGDNIPGQDGKSKKKWLAQSIKKAHYFIAGSVSRLENNFIITARICNAYTGQVLPGTSVTQTCIHEYQIYDRVRNMTLFLAAQLHNRGVHSPLSRYIGTHSKSSTAQADTP